MEEDKTDLSEYVFMMYVFIYCYIILWFLVCTHITERYHQKQLKEGEFKTVNLCGAFLFVFFNLPEVSDEDAMKKLEKRNDETTVSEARARYLQRKQQRQQSKPL